MTFQESLVPNSFLPVASEDTEAEASIKRGSRSVNPINYWLPHELSILMLSFNGGFFDSVSYVKFNRVFTASITGNLVGVVSFFYLSDGVLLRFLVSTFFVLGALLATVINVKLKLVNEWKPRSIYLLLFILEAVFIIVLIIIGGIYNDIPDDDPYNRYVIILTSLMSTAMGIQNALSKEYIPNCPSTTVMTMTLITTGVQMAYVALYTLADASLIKLYPATKINLEIYRSDMAEKAKKSREQFVTTTKPLAVFLIGSAVGTALVTQISMYSMFFPLLLTLIPIIDLNIARTRENSDEANNNVAPQSGADDIIVLDKTSAV